MLPFLFQVKRYSKIFVRISFGNDVDLEKEFIKNIYNINEHRKVRDKSQIFYIYIDKSTVYQHYLLIIN